MALEATVLCLDGSEFMRNGDYVPTRMEAMKDAASLLCRIKTDMNPESTVGIVACGLPLGPKVLCSCSQDMGSLLSACSNIAIAGGKADFVRSLEVAALALKHRRNKNGDQRIVSFVGSPIEDEEAALVKLAKKLKKNNISVDIVAMGEVEDNEPKLRTFIEAVDKSSTSHLVVIPPGVLPSEVIMTSPIVTGGMGGGDGGEGGTGGAGAAAAAFAEYGGVDPSIDPELAMALRASMEEARARMSAETGNVESTPVRGEAPAAEADQQIPTGMDPEEEELLRQALQMSVGEQEGGETDNKTPASHQGDEDEDDEEDDGEDDEDDEDAKALALALAMSQEQDAPPAAASGTGAQQQSAEGGETGGFLDANYVKELMEGLEGVDFSDPQIQKFVSGSSDAKPGDGPDSKKQKKEDKDEK